MRGVEIRKWLPTDGDISSFQHSGLTEYEAFYSHPRCNLSFAANTIVASRLYVMPFLSRNSIADLIAIRVLTASPGLARLGIYIDDCHKKNYPRELILDAGEVSVSTTGAKTISIRQPFTNRTLYWLAMVSDATPQLGHHQYPGIINILGTNNTLPTAVYTCIYVAFAYGLLPNPFPIGGTMKMSDVAGAHPGIFLRFI